MSGIGCLLIFFKKTALIALTWNYLRIIILPALNVILQPAKTENLKPEKISEKVIFHLAFLPKSPATF